MAKEKFTVWNKKKSKIVNSNILKVNKSLSDNPESEKLDPYQKINDEKMKNFVSNFDSQIKKAAKDAK